MSTTGTGSNSANGQSIANSPSGTGGSGGSGPGSGGGGAGSNQMSGSNQSNGSNNNGSMVPLDNEACGIRDVWAVNLYDEFKVINSVVKDYPWIAMDTEFPGVVARPIGEFKSTCDYQYHLLKVNVDLLKIIQLGLTFLDDDGKPRPGISTWQFNFKFNLSEDMYAQDSIELLTNSGIQFKKHEEEGIDVFEFAELLMISGVVLNDNVKYLSFHSGYDFGYLIKILTELNLPSDESEFFELLRIYFPIIYDVKYLMKSCKDLKGGLQEVADQLDLQRIGPQHQAGSDSLLTGAAFFKMREVFFEDTIDDNKYCGHLYGLGTTFVNGNIVLIDTNSVSSNNNSESNNSTTAATVSTSTTNTSSTTTTSTTVPVGGSSSTNNAD